MLMLTAIKKDNNNKTTTNYLIFSKHNFTVAFLGISDKILIVNSEADAFVGAKCMLHAFVWRSLSQHCL